MSNKITHEKFIQKVEDIKRPLIKGEKFLVSCLVKKEYISKGLDELWLDLENKKTKERLHILPIINHIHNDIENGQIESHYHLDYRFIKHKKDNNFPSIINKHSYHIFGSEIRPLKNFGKLEYHILPVINEEFSGITPLKMISKSKLKHKCIYKGKCPHRGYDLSQVEPNKEGIVVCPLHGLKFKNSKII